MGQQRVDELVAIDPAAARLQHEAHRGVFAGLVAHRVEHRQDQRLGLLLVCRERLLAGLDLGVGQLLDLLEHLLRGDTRRQLGDHQLPLAARQIFEHMAGAHLEAATAICVGVADVFGRADHLAAARKVGARQHRHHLVERGSGVAHQHLQRGHHLAQVVRRHLGGHAHGNAAGAIEQRERQPRRQQRGLLEVAVVVVDELDRAFIQFIEQQPRNRGQARLGVAHRGRAVAVARAEVALAVDQRVAQREVLRHPHQRLVGGLIAMRMELAQHVTDHAGALDRLGTRRQPHLVHREQDAPLHRLLAVADIGQRAALDDRDRVVEVGLLGKTGQRQRIAAFGRRWRGVEQELLIGHEDSYREGRPAEGAARAAMLLRWPM